jgi:hypothetical protein
MRSPDDSVLGRPSVEARDANSPYTSNKNPQTNAPPSLQPVSAEVSEHRNCRKSNWSGVSSLRFCHRRMTRIYSGGGERGWKARFHYRQDTVFNASTYFAFLEQLARSYRRQGAVLILGQRDVPQRRRRMGLIQCQSPLAGSSATASLLPGVQSNGAIVEIHAPTGTHNRYSPDENELTGTLSRVFGEMQTYPELIRPYLQSLL